MPYENILRLLVCALAIFFALILIPYFISRSRLVISYVLRLKPLWIRDVSQDNVEMSPELQQMESDLYQLGFGRLGILLIRSRLTTNPLHEWHYANADGSIYAESVQMGANQPALMQFATRFSDGSFVVTRYSVGENLETPMYASHFARYSLENALRYHQWKIADWQQTHGEPIPVQGLEDTSAHDEEYRQHYQHLEGRRGIAIHTILALLCAWFIILGYIIPRIVVNDSSVEQATRMLALHIGSLAVAAVLLMVLPRLLTTQRGAVDEGYEGTTA
ncbi:MAG: hypothetical protein KF726_27970 [Anaerolineae bacterium]|nr:hypothetical protein [Anaerolineae bacterium]